MTLPCDHEKMREFCVKCNCSIINCKENASTYKLQKDNKWKVCKVEYDNKYCNNMHTGGPRADILLFSCRNKMDKCKIAIIVELKGKNVRHAQEQINKTLERENQVLSEYVVIARIASNAPVSACQNVSELTNLFRNLKKHNNNLCKSIINDAIYKIRKSYSNPELLSSIYRSISW